VPELAAGSVPNFNRVQEQLASAVREERQLQPVLRPGRLPGTVEAELKVNDRLPLGGSVELNNQHAAATEPWRLQANLHYDNLWQRDHALALTFITAPQAPEQSKVVSANYAAPLATDWSLLAYAVWSDSVVEPIGTSVIGQGFTLGLRAVRAIALGASSHTLSVGADFKDLKERLEFGDGSLSTPLRYLPLQVAYTGNWSDGRAFTSLNAQFVLALRGILQRDVDCPGSIGAVDQFACKREGGDGSFSHLRIDLRHTREAPLLPGTLVLRLAGQQAAQPLVSAEQFAIGGADSVRGYLEAEASGDRALLASVEWRSPSLWQRDAADDSAWAVDDVSMLGFVEAARVWTEQPSVGQHGRASLYAAGVGLRLRAARTLTAALDLAVPGKATASSPQRDPRLHLKLRAQF
jgi:hemolysin activation/secretion protein